MKTNRIFTLLLIAAMLVTTAACGSQPPSGTDTTPAADSTSGTEPDEGYVFPEYDGKSEDFTILNCSNTWGFYTNLDFETASGETLDDAIVDRNRTVEEKFNVDIKIVEQPMYQTAAEHYQTSIISGDHQYDAAFIPTINMAPFVTESYLYNLVDIPELHLDEPYYDQSVNTAARVGADDIQYFACNYTSLSGIDGVLCLFFNENMLNDLNKEAPYQLVRDGQWTLDRYGEYLKAGTNLNGDDSFAWDENGAAVYGMASWKDGFGAFIAGAGVNFVTLDEEQYPVFNVNERLYDVLNKVDTVLSDDGVFISQNDSGNGHYEMMFKNGRSLFMLAELKASSKYRDMNDTFGIVPLPKYDEKQENYSSYRSRYELLMSVPTTNPDPERAGIVLDALAYLSYENVLPIYYDYRLSAKQLRSDDSVEMLDIIRSTMNFDTGFPFGWTFDLYTTLSVAISQKAGGYASAVAQKQSAIETQIKDTMDLINDK